MKKIYFTIVCIYISLLSLGQTAEYDKLIQLGKAYKDFMFLNEPPKNFVKDLLTKVPENLKFPSNFIAQTITKDNDLLSKTYLSLPDSQTLKYIYIIRCIYNNFRKESQTNNTVIIDSLLFLPIPKNELIDGYYAMLFSGIGNKNKPFNLTKMDFNLNQYHLTGETEKGIFFLECMRYCGTEIWGYINIAKPMNTKKALEYIQKFPKFNGLKYYQFTDLFFPDFEMVITEGKDIESYKGYYIDKYYDLLLSHLICLNKEGAKQQEINELLLGSILKDSNLYKYTKNKATLEQIFKEQK